MAPKAQLNPAQPCLFSQDNGKAFVYPNHGNVHRLEYYYSSWYSVYTSSGGMHGRTRMHHTNIIITRDDLSWHSPPFLLVFICCSPLSSHSCTNRLFHQTPSIWRYHEKRHTPTHYWIIHCQISFKRISPRDGWRFCLPNTITEASWRYCMYWKRKRRMHE